LGDYLDRYADWLSEQGFCRAAARLHLVQIADFSLWLDKQGLTLNDIQLTTIDSFLEDRRRRVKPPLSDPPYTGSYDSCDRRHVHKLIHPSVLPKFFFRISADIS
jgi:hypothetical protein